MPLALREERLRSVACEGCAPLPASWRVAGRGGDAHEHSFPKAEWHRERPPCRQRRHCAPPRGADRLGRSDLANAAGEVGSVACVEGPRQSAEGPTAAPDRIRASDQAARISQLRKSSRTASQLNFSFVFNNLQHRVISLVELARVIGRDYLLNRRSAASEKRHPGDLSEPGGELALKDWVFHFLAGASGRR